MQVTGIKLKADRLYKRLVCGGLILGCVSGVGRKLSVGSLLLLIKTFSVDLYYKNYDLEKIDGEEWMDCLGYDGIYSVSNLGRIKSELRYRADNGQRIRERIMKQQVVKTNFHNLKEPTKSLNVSFCVDKIKVTHKVATLVGQAFVGELKDGECYSKKNKIWNDCRAENLEIKTISESTEISYEKGNNLRKKKCLIKNHTPMFIWTRQIDGKEFRSDELFAEYKKEIRANLNKGIKKNKQRYGSYWSKRAV